MQSRGNGVNRGTKSQFPVATRIIRGQDVVLGSVLYLGKKAPTGTLKQNIFLNYHIGEIEKKPELEKIVTYLDNSLSGTITDVGGDAEKYGIMDNFEDVMYINDL